MIDKNERLINKYTIKDLKERKSIVIIIPLNQREINNLKYIKKGTTIKLRSNDNNIDDEVSYLKNAIKAINELAATGNTYSVIVSINNRELLRKSKLIGNMPRNINLIINTDEYDYNLHEYLKDEKKLERMVEMIRNSNLSPLEKYIAVYNNVKKYRIYKQEEKGQSEKISRSLRYVLDETNNYIVCSGFARLLKDQLDRVDIPCSMITLSVEDTDKNKWVGHARNIVRIDDDKYNIHGLYIADSTWDNKADADLYLNSLSTFDRRKETKRPETLEDHDLLFDFHSPDEFATKMKYYFKKHCSLPKITAAGEEELRKRSYKDLYIKIINYLIIFDYQKYQELYNKYNDYLNVDINQTTSNRMEISMTNFLYDYAKYIVPLSNKEIGMDKILTAAAEVKRHIYLMDNQEISNWLARAKKENLEDLQKRFPYVYNPDNPTEGYLEERNTHHK